LEQSRGDNYYPPGLYRDNSHEKGSWHRKSRENKRGKKKTGGKKKVKGNPERPREKTASLA